jgi:hypothetical protein
MFPKRRRFSWEVPFNKVAESQECPPHTGVGLNNVHTCYGSCRSSA